MIRDRHPSDTEVMVFMAGRNCEEVSLEPKKRRFKNDPNGLFLSFLKGK